MRTRPGDIAAALARATYRKSTRSSGTGSCVAVAHALGHVGIQDTKEGDDSRHRATLAVPATAFADLLKALAL